MRVFFIGTVHFSREMLLTLIKVKSIQIVGVATKSSSLLNSDHSDLSDLAISNGINYKYVKDINAQHIVEWIERLKPDIIFCLGWSSLIKKSVLEIPKIGVVGYHPAELPKNKGRHPLIWALVLGLKQTASTFFIMDEGADSGDIINQNIVQIELKDSASTLYNKIIFLAKKQLIEIIDNLQNNNLIKIPQKPFTGNIWRKRSKVDGRIDWRMRSIDIYNLVRALSEPYPGAHFEYMDQEIKVWNCELIYNENPVNIEPGKVISISGNYIIVKTGDGLIKLSKHELNLNSIGEYLI